METQRGTDAAENLGFSALEGRTSAQSAPVPITGLFSCRSSGAMLSRCPRSLGEVPERSNGAVSKTVVPLTGDRGFESLPLRQPLKNTAEIPKSLGQHGFLILPGYTEGI